MACSGPNPLVGSSSTPCPVPRTALLHIVGDAGMQDVSYPRLCSEKGSPSFVQKSTSFFYSHEGVFGANTFGFDVISPEHLPQHPDVATFLCLFKYGRWNIQIVFGGSGLLDNRCTTHFLCFCSDLHGNFRLFRRWFVTLILLFFALVFLVL